jgi:hypothetical protein
MAREFTQSEAQQIYEAEKGLRESGLDVDHEHAKDNANLILDYFGKNPIPVTVASIYAFVEKNKNQFVWRTPAQREYDKIAAQNPQAAQQLAAWLDTQGKAGQLANQGDDAYANLTLLLTELRNRRENASSKAIQDAINRIQNRPGRKLHYVEAPRRSQPVSVAAKNDDSNSTNWLGRDMIKNPDGSYRNKTATEQRQDMEAAEKAKAQTTPTQHEPDAWEGLCQQLLNYGTHHSQRAAMRETYERGVQRGMSFREIYSELTSLKKQYEFSPAPLAPSIKARSIQ